MDVDSALHLGGNGDSDCIRGPLPPSSPTGEAGRWLRGTRHVSFARSHSHRDQQPDISNSCVFPNRPDAKTNVFDPLLFVYPAFSHFSLHFSPFHALPIFPDWTSFTTLNVMQSVRHIPSLSIGRPPAPTFNVSLRVDDVKCVGWRSTLRPFVGVWPVRDPTMAPVLIVVLRAVTD